MRRITAHPTKNMLLFVPLLLGANAEEGAPALSRFWCHKDVDGVCETGEASFSQEMMRDHVRNVVSSPRVASPQVRSMRPAVVCALVWA